MNDEQRMLDKLAHHKAMAALVKLIPAQPQRQDSTNDQLRDLVQFANRLGMYDAADFIRATAVLAKVKA